MNVVLPAFQALQGEIKKAGSFQNLIHKSLTTADDSAGVLIHRIVDQELMTRLVMRFPELSMWLEHSERYARMKGGKYERKFRTEGGDPGSAMGETADIRFSSPAFEDETWRPTIIGRGDEVSFKAQDEITDWRVLNESIKAVIEDLGHDLLFYLFRGNKAANPFEMDGINYWVGKTSSDPANIPNRLNVMDPTNGQARPITDYTNFVHEVLDHMIDTSNNLGGMEHARFFRMSSELISAISADLSANRLHDIRFGYIKTGFGFRVLSYRGIPFIETFGVGGTMGRSVESLSAQAGPTTGGSFGVGNHYFAIAAESWHGESVRSPIQSVNFGSGTENIVELLPPNEETRYTGNEKQKRAIKYRIYYSATPNPQDLRLVDEQSAFNYASDGTIGNRKSVISVLSPNPTAAVSHLRNDRPLYFSANGAAPEELQLVDIDPEGVGNLRWSNAKGSQQKGLIDLIPLDRGKKLVDRFGAYAFPVNVISRETSTVIVRGLAAR